MNLKKFVQNSWCFKFANTTPGKYLKFFILLSLDLINLLVDWYFYAKIQLIEPGLVYGPPEKAIKWTIFVFCNISIFSFFIETIQNADDLQEKRKLPFLTQSLTNFIVIIFEDIPLLALNLMITVCRDGEPTVISVIKASVCIAVVFIRVALLMSRYWLFDNKKSRFNFVLDLMSTLGLVLIALMSIAIQLLNNFPTNSNGRIQPTNPVRFNRMQYVKNKYLSNVGIFTRWPIDHEPSNETNPKYIWLADINEVIDNTYFEMKINIMKGPSAGSYFLCLDKSKSSRICYISEKNAQQSYFTQANFSSNSTDYLQTYDLVITKEPAQEYKYLVGYLDYNIQKSAYDENNRAYPADCAHCKFKLIYAKFSHELESNRKSHLRNNLEKGFSFYDFNVDLSTVDKIWRTGVIGCKMNADLGPKLNDQIQNIY